MQCSKTDPFISSGCCSHTSRNSPIGKALSKLKFTLFSV